MERSLAWETGLGSCQWGEGYYLDCLHWEGKACPLLVALFPRQRTLDCIHEENNLSASVHTFIANCFCGFLALMSWDLEPGVQQSPSPLRSVWRECVITEQDNNNRTICSIVAYNLSCLFPVWRINPGPITPNLLEAEVSPMGSIIYLCQFDRLQY